MRYYSIKIDGAPSVFPARYDGGAQWGTILNGVHDPNAQQVEMQLVEYNATTLTENSVITIYGVSWDQIKACNQLVGKPITINGGMTPGLPLATFQSRRPTFLMQAIIFKCWGNWIGTEMSIGMSFAPAGVAVAQSGGGGGGGGGGGNGGGGGGGGEVGAQNVVGGTQVARVDRTGFRSIDRMSLPKGRVSIGARAFSPLGVDPSALLQSIGGQLISDFDIGPATSQFGNVIGSFFGGGNISPLAEPINLIHNLMPNMPLSSAVQETLSKAFPSANVNVLISQGLKLAYQDAAIHQSLEQYAGLINNLSQSILGTKAYPGVQISSYDNTINVWDGSSPVGVGDISYLELVGQPTWLTVNTISVKVVLRGGLHIGYHATLPQTLVGFGGADSVLGGGASSSDQRTHITLPGDYTILKVMHIGDFRNPDGASWTTNYEMLTAASTASQAVEQLPTQQGLSNVEIRPVPGG